MKNKNKKLMEQVNEVLAKRGQKAFEIARNLMLREKIQYKPLNDALRYFLDESWYDVQHPALISLTCEAVGGNPEETTQIGAAIVLLTGAADIHDDIIDKSKVKNSKFTVYGKFGRDIALLVGDALIFEGLTFLLLCCQRLPKRKRNTILKLIKQAFFEIGEAEAYETDLRGKYDIEAKKYLNLIKRKAAIAEAAARVGAIIGDGTSEEIRIWGHYGRILGILMTIRDEFVDMFEHEELRSRIENECLPLPILYALKNKNVKKKVLPLLKKSIHEENANRIAQEIMETEEIIFLKRKMENLIRDMIRKLKFNQNSATLKKIMHKLLYAAIEDL
jgi:geranylgeranyl diphosphate synthase type I